MTRETKVGLLIGLGVILLVGIIISEYFVRDDSLRDTPLAHDLSDFGSNTNQPLDHRPSGTGGNTDHRAYANRGVTASAVERLAEPRPGPAVPSNAALPGPRTGPAYPSTSTARAGSGFGERTGGEAQTPVAEPGHPPLPTRSPIYAGGAADTRHLNTSRDLNPEPQVAILDGTVPITLEDTAPPPATVRHTVMEGQSMRQIAKLHYNGDGDMWRSIRDANPGLVGPEGQVRAGVVLAIPKRSIGRDPGQAAAQTQVDQTLATGERTVAVRGRRVTAQDGDTLSGLAAEHLGSAGQWQVLLDANTDILTDPRHLRAGMQLRIPTTEEAQVVDDANAALRGETPRPTTSTQAPAPNTPAPGRTYTVRSGDSLYRIAEQTLGDGNRYHELFEANQDQLENADAIREGMVLRIPNDA